MKTVSVYSKIEFKKEIYNRDPTRTAFISIESSPECIKYRLEEDKDDYDNDHLLLSSDNVLNIEFDDIPGPGDYKYKEHWMKSMTVGQGRTIVDFIERNLGKDFVVHCKAGKSRSKAVGRFILDIFGDRYTDGNPSNPIGDAYNVDILGKLKEAYYKKYNLFWYSSDKLAIIKKIKEDVGKYVHWAWPNPDYPASYEKVDPQSLGFLIGAIDGVDDYYWVSVNRDLTLRMVSCSLGYTVIYNPDQYTDIEYEEFMKGNEGLVNDKFLDIVKGIITGNLIMNSGMNLTPDNQIPIEDYIFGWYENKGNSD